jgi:hypothetical protein
MGLLFLVSVYPVSLKDEYGNSDAKLRRNMRVLLKSASKGGQFPASLFMSKTCSLWISVEPRVRHYQCVGSQCYLKLRNLKINVK